MHFLLVHGAWHGGWCWERLEAEFHARHIGYSILDLPGLGDDTTPASEISLAAYTEHVTRFVIELDRPVELVGHSMAGAVITEVAEQLPGFIEGLIYLCAFLPRNGETLAELGREDREAGLNAALVRGDDPDTVQVAEDAARELFYQDCRIEDAEAAIARLRPQATAPFHEPVRSTDERWGSVPRSYILCNDDRAISPAMQRRMLARVPCDPVVELASGHSPFYSNPAALAAALEQIASSR